MHRYLGIFDLIRKNGRPPELKLSDAGARIIGNQRRVTAEEMGIGFGTLLARHWLTQAQGFNSAISVIDIDAALDDGFVEHGGVAPDGEEDTNDEEPARPIAGSYL